MKYLFFVICCFMAYSCTQTKEKEYCFSSLVYKSRKYESMPDLITLNIQDKSHLVSSKFKSKQIEKVIFFSLPIEQREHFSAWSVEPAQDSVSVKIITGFFNSENGRKVWKSKEVENLLLKDSIGLVAGKDTIIVKSCK